ncbi:hypothetical protein HMPREF9441_03548 [Paraprevotella clara YIT 11840]|uniref:Uncharacterized protein n=1 Tax=Paraprevotella clara YIT 11840 TaxID=762968 RepID=G5SVX7_9BACT|nr:hypothetical protein HMPREF9441_03548 [Paraprevotella clara YIT 11840]
MFILCRESIDSAKIAKKELYTKLYSRFRIVRQPRKSYICI